MNYSKRELLGMLLGAWAWDVRWLRPMVFRFDGRCPDGRSRYVNRISRHVEVSDRG